MIFGNIVFNLFAMQAEAILYAVLSDDIGRQFFRYRLGFSAFGMHVIMRCLWDTDNSSLQNL